MNSPERTGKARSTSAIKRSSNGSVKSNHIITWTETQTKSLNVLIDCLLKQAVMAFPDYQLPYLVHIDASVEGLGAVVQQKQGTDLKVIAFPHAH